MDLHIQKLSILTLNKEDSNNKSEELLDKPTIPTIFCSLFLGIVCPNFVSNLLDNLDYAPFTLTSLLRLQTPFRKAVKVTVCT
jgi:hypothetical protein